MENGEEYGAVMPATIRLARHGARKRPFYRIVVMDKRSPRDSARIEQLGFYDPGTEPARIELKADRVREWLRRGARPSATVERLIKKSGVLQQEKPQTGESP